MNRDDILTVIIPVRNGGDYLGRCIESLTNQSLKKLKILVVDDCSNDNTVEIASSYAEKNPQISVVCHSMNLGTGSARNTGLNLATSPYVAFLDADDWIDTNAYSEMISALEKTNSDVAICGIKTEYTSITESTVRYSYPYKNELSARFALRLLCRCEMQDVFISPMVGNKVFRRSLLQEENLLFPKRSYYEDDEFSFKVFASSNKVVLVPNVFQHYFQREGSAMHSFSEEVINQMFSAFRSIRMSLDDAGAWKALEQEFYSFLDKCLSSLLDTMFSCVQNVSAQRKYISTILKQLLNDYTIEELIANIEPSRLQRLWE